MQFTIRGVGKEIKGIANLSKGFRRDMYRVAMLTARASDVDAAAGSITGKIETKKARIEGSAPTPKGLPRMQS